MLPVKVSVIIPAYNEEKWIGKTLEAVLAQDYPDFEVIVVDNASTDKTSDVVRSYSDPRLQLVNEPTKGILHAREAGRKVATGEIIAQLDADCLPKKDWISNAVKRFENKNTVAVSGPYYYYDSPLLSRTCMFLIQATIFTAMSNFVQIGKRGGLIIGGNAFIRSDALAKVGGYNTALAFYGEDTDTACRIAPYGRIVYTVKNTLPTSGRRFHTFGFLKLGWRYIQAFFAVVHKKKYQKSQEEEHPR